MLRSRVVVPSEGAKIAITTNMKTTTKPNSPHVWLSEPVDHVVTGRPVGVPIVLPEREIAAPDPVQEYERVGVDRERREWPRRLPGTIRGTSLSIHRTGIASRCCRRCSLDSSVGKFASASPKVANGAAIGLRNASLLTNVAHGTAIIMPHSAPNSSARSTRNPANQRAAGRGLSAIRSRRDFSSRIRGIGTHVMHLHRNRHGGR